MLLKSVGRFGQQGPLAPISPPENSFRNTCKAADRELLPVRAWDLTMRAALLDEDGPLAANRIGASYIFPAIGHFETHQSGTNMRVWRNEKWNKQHLKQGTRFHPSGTNWNVHAEERFVMAFTQPGQPVIRSPLGPLLDSDNEWTVFRTHPFPNQRDIPRETLWQGLQAAVPGGSFEEELQSEQQQRGRPSKRARRSQRKDVGSWHRRVFTPYEDAHGELCFDAAPLQAPGELQARHEASVLLWNDRGYLMPRQGVCDAVYAVTQQMAKDGLEVQPVGVQGGASSSAGPAG